ncbi:MAG: hypothetical protein LBI29_02710, partial [Rickettsiales bacterium]|nr:hypothetical protein [Rickettsiales bacterium]
MNRKRDNVEKDEKGELIIKKLLLGQLNIASEELDKLVNLVVAQNKEKKRIIVNGSLPMDILRQLKALGYDVIELEPEQEYGPEMGAIATGIKQTNGPLRTTQVSVSARNPDPGLAVKNDEAARALAEKYGTPKQKLRNTLVQNSLGDKQAFNDKFPKKDKTDNQRPEREGPAGGWIGEIGFSGDVASCTIHYHNEAERVALEAKAIDRMNTMLNEKSYVRQEANR